MGFHHALPRTGVLGASRVLLGISVGSVLLAAAACAGDPPSPPGPAPVVSSFTALGSPHVEPALVPLHWEAGDPQGDPIRCRLDGDGDGVWDQTLDPCPSPASRNTAEVAAGTHTARLEVSDGENTTVATTTYTVAARGDDETFDIVIRPSGSVDPDVLTAMEQAAVRWERVITRGLTDMPVTTGPGSCGTGSAAFDGVVDDLQINLSMQDIPAAAWATPCVYGPDDLPRLGMVEFDPDLVPDQTALHQLDEIAVHEIGHVLGFGVVWQRGRDLVLGADGPDPRFVGPRARAENSRLGRLADIPIMIIDGVISPHWESAFLGPEIMATVPDGSALSALTVASLADVGYAVDMDAADPYDPPLAAGTCIGFAGDISRCW